MRRFRTVTATTLLVVPIVAGGFLMQERPVHATAHLFEQVVDLVSRQYVDSVNMSALYEKAAKGMVRELNDPYSELMTPKASESFTRGTGGRYGGTGMYIEEQQGSIVVYRVFPNTPAEEAGVMEGDRIISIDDKSVQGWQLTKVSETLRGTVGSQVKVSYQRNGVPEPITLTFTRRTVHVPAVEYAAMLDDKVGYIPLQTFNENAAEEVEAAVKKLESQGAKGLVLDMRDNGGGIVDQALEVSSLFLRDGAEIASIRGRNSKVEVARSQGSHIATSIPLVVLLDENSASATEIVAGALQDHDRALVVGTTSFGKGLVQSVFPLDGGYSLKMTTGKWFTPSGRSIHKERKFEDGHFLEDKPDSTPETEAERRQRPQYKSDAGRVVYGGGGIAPDVLVSDDTLATVESEFLRSVASKGQTVQTVLARYALELKGSVKPEFKATPDWTAELMHRMSSAGVTIDSKYDSVAPKLLTQELEHRVARQAFGDGMAKRRELGRDRQLSKAVELLHHSASQVELFAAAHPISSMTR
jgi:carboxyl-terminal processing protease